MTSLPSRLLSLARRAIGKSPMYVARRALTEIARRHDRWKAPLLAARFDDAALVRATGVPSIDALWKQLANRPYFAIARAGSEVLPLEQEEIVRVVAGAEAALGRNVELLGSGPLQLGTPIDWLSDPKTSMRWPEPTAFGVDYNNPDRPSDVKLPWETSRLQWLLPTGQAYAITGDERYARCAREVLEEWMTANPYAGSINWACTMEVALRILTWTCLFHACHDSTSWRDIAFRSRFLRALWLHADFTERYIERADINGNHFTADAAGLVFAGLFFGDAASPRRWHTLGWRELQRELPRQVTEDGVDFEASIAYHRLVEELFLLPALYRERFGLETPPEYRRRVIAMARFTAAYSRSDGTSPLVGDADDARALPLGTQALLDHRYLCGLVAAAWDDAEAGAGFGGSRSEIAWLLGSKAAEKLDSAPVHRQASMAFPQGGFYVLRNERDHVFIDCGPVGLAGRGGHGHNDCLSFEAMLDGVSLVTDCGAYVYTASYEERNRFRSTSYHNTPQIDGIEINRFYGWDQLWTLRNEAIPRVTLWATSRNSLDVFRGTHSGYKKLIDSQWPIRTIALDHSRHALLIHDHLTGSRERTVEVPLHLAIGVSVGSMQGNSISLRANDRSFVLCWKGDDWSFTVSSGRCSPSYGRAFDITRLIWKTSKAGPLDLTVILARSMSDALGLFSQLDELPSPTPQ